MSRQIPTLEEVLDQLFTEMGEELGFKVPAVTAVGASSTATTTEPRLTNPFASQFDNYFLWTLAATLAANRSKQITNIAATSGTATITHAGPNYTVGAADLVGYILRIDPTILLNIIADALALEYYRTTVPLTEVVDGDMQTSGVASWTATNAELSKVTAAANVPFELAQVLSVLSTAAGGNGESGLLRIPRGKSIYPWVIGRAEVGTALCRLVDSAGVSIDTITTTQEDWQFLWKSISPASTVEKIAFQLGGSALGDQTYWAAAGFLRPGVRDVTLPSWLSRRFQFESLSIADFPVSGDETGAEFAGSRRLRALSEPRGEFRLSFPELAANPARIELRPDLTGKPLFLTALRPFGDVDTLAALPDLTRCDLDLVVQRTKHLLGKSLKSLFGAYFNEGLIAADAIRRQGRTERPRERSRSWTWG